MALPNLKDKMDARNVHRYITQGPDNADRDNQWTDTITQRVNNIRRKAIVERINPGPVVAAARGLTKTGEKEGWHALAQDRAGTNNGGFGEEPGLSITSTSGAAIAQEGDAQQGLPPCSDDEDGTDREYDYMDDGLFVDEPSCDESDLRVRQAVADLADGLIPRLSSCQKATYLKIGRDLGVAMAESVAARAAVGTTMLEMGILEGEDLKRVEALVRSIPHAPTSVN